MKSNLGLGVFVFGIMTLWTVMVSFQIARADPTRDPSLPTIPPPLPTYVVQGDGTRLDCTPDFSVCWKENPTR